MPRPTKLNTSKSIIDVVALVLEDNKGNILISKRSPEKHQGGLWEFPGGKLELNESLEQALHREIKEELNYSILSCEHLITVEHSYSDLTVILHCYHSIDPQAKVESAEDQPLKWVHKSKLNQIAMPAADHPIIQAINQ